MPTPVSVAREYLTPEAARVLEDAVSVARRRSHSQTTSLHVISALLALPSSALRDACNSRAKSSAYSARLQFRALELCVGVSLDRVPSSKSGDDPPVSNSLMAAIKRSQACQRRNPDSLGFVVNQQIMTNATNIGSTIKVELKYFTISILDDPTVSKVLGEAGFRSTEIKLAMIHPPVSRVWSNRTARYPPMFLCNLTDNVTGSSSTDENCRRISEVLGKKKNPLLVGVCGFDALKKFVEFSNGENAGKEVNFGGLSVISVESEISEFVNGGDERKLMVRFEEVGEEIERCVCSEIVVNVGDLRVLVGDNVSSDCVKFVVEKLTALLQRFREKMRLIAAASSYEVYRKFLGQFPSVEMDWDLNLLPITSSKSSVDSFGSKSSLMGSFVPFGGFFPMPTDFRSPLGGTSQTMTIARCHLCTAKYEQELAAMLKAGAGISVADQYAENLPSWLRMAEAESSKGMDAAKVKDDGITLNAKVLGLQKKWDDLCQRLHHAQPLSSFEIPRVTSLSQLTDAEGSRQFADRKESSSNSSSRDSAINIGKHAPPSLCIDMNSPKTLPSEHTVPIFPTSRGDGSDFQSKVHDNVSRDQVKEKEIPWIARPSLPSWSLPTDRTSSSSVTSVTTDLGLGTIYASRTWETNSPILRDRKELHLHYSGLSSTEHDAANENTSRQIAQSSSCTGPSVGVQFDSQDYKSMRRSLSEKVSWQHEAICTIVDAISRCRAGCGKNSGLSSRRDIWLTFLGPDKIGKKKIALALFETLYGSLGSFISVDCSYGEFSSLNTIFDFQESYDNDVKFRGKTVVDYIATELRKKPHTLVFLESIDKADPQVQSSLLQAVRTGRFRDSYGREVSIASTVFVTASTLSCQNKNTEPEKKTNKFSEDRIVGAKRLQMKIFAEFIADSAGRSNEMNVATDSENSSATTAMNKRKLVEVSHSVDQEETLENKKRAHKLSRTHLDLNLPLEETEADVSYSECESDIILEASDPWLEEFFDQVDATVEFKPFNFHILADNILKEITAKFLKHFGSKVPLEIEGEVIVQIIAASWLSDRREAMEEWVDKVLSRGFAELRQKYEPSSSSCQYIVKLICCKDLVAEEQAPGICLPATINL